ncbi:MAG: hypothetical protein RIM80_18285 [Alphaproteobacteria bacterium]
MSITVLDPTYGGGAAAFQMAPRLADLGGRTIGVISNGKKGSGRLFAALSEALRAAGAGEVVLRVKSNYSAPADAHIMEEAKGWQAAFTGIGD